MKKKYLILVLIIILINLCGCTVNYEININDDVVTENMEFYETDSKKINALYPPDSVSSDSIEKYTYKQMINFQNLNDEYAFKNNLNPEQIYNKRKIDESNKMGMKYSYAFNINDYTNSNIANSFVTHFSARTSGEFYAVSALDFSSIFSQYPYLNNISVKIKTNHKVVDSTADSTEGNEYIWNITKSNAKTKNVSIKLYKYASYSNKSNNNLSKEKLFSNIRTILIVVLCIAISLFIVIIILRKKANRNNRI